MLQQSLGDRIKELRLGQGVSLRKFAEKIEITPSFMSDIELGRRYPSDDVLKTIAKHLNVPFEELKSFDVRESLTEIRKMVHEDRRWGLAFRMVEEQAKQQGLTAEEMMKRLSTPAPLPKEPGHEDR